MVHRSYQPAWAKDLAAKKAGKAIPEQITILPSSQPSQQRPMQHPIYNPSTQPPIMPGLRYTGLGSDNTLQPMKRADDAHEGEFIFSAEVTQAIDPEVLQVITQKAQSGQLDNNALRAALGIQQKQGYATGGFVVNPIMKNTAPTPIKPIQPSPTPAVSNTILNQTVKSPVSVTPQPVANVAPEISPIQIASPIQATNRTVTNTAPEIEPLKVAPTVQVTQKTVAAPSAPAIQPITLKTQPVPSQQQSPVSSTPQPTVTSAQAEEARQLNELGASNAAAQAAALQRARQMGLSDSLQTVLAGDMIRSAETAQSDLRSNIYKTNLDKKESSTNNLLSQIQANVPFDALKQEIMNNNPGMDEVGALKYYNSVKTGNLQVDAGTRISTLLTGGQSLSQILSDTALRSDAAARLGTTAEDPAVDNELKTLYNATLKNMRGSAITETEKLIADAIDNKQSLDATMSDNRVRQQVGIALGLDPMDVANKTAIDNEIQRRYSYQTMPGEDRMYKQFMDNYPSLLQQFSDTPGYEAELKRAIADLTMQGVIVDGKVVNADKMVFPWETPDSFSKYTDWNGNDITYDAVGNKAAGYADTKVNYTGNGTTYKKADGTAITFGDLDRIWNDMSVMEKSEHFVDGKPDMEYLMKKASVTSTGSNGTPVSGTEEIVQYFVENPKEYDTISGYLDNFEWYAPGNMPGDVSTTNPNGGAALKDINTFVYTDENGAKQFEDYSSGPGRTLLAGIWKQLSDKYNGGKLLSPQEFNLRWNNGEGWTVDDEGKITNIDTKGSASDLSKIALNRINSYIHNSFTTPELWDDKTSKYIWDNWNTLESNNKVSTSIGGKEYSEYVLESVDTNVWQSGVGSGKRRWKLTDDIERWVDANTGKLYKASNGRIYEILGRTDTRDSSKSTAYIRLRDVQSGEEIHYNKHKGGSENRLLPK